MTGENWKQIGDVASGLIEKIKRKKAVTQRGLTEEQAKAVAELRNSPINQKSNKPMAWRRIARQLGLSEERILEHFAPDSAYVNRNHTGRVLRYTTGENVFVPPNVIEERDRVMNQDFSINVLLLGDPPPGRSALDRKLNETSA